MISNLKSYFVAVAIYLGDSARRRAVASLIMAGALYFGGVALDIDHVETMIGLLLPFAAAWSSHTPKIEGDTTEADTDKAGA